MASVASPLRPHDARSTDDTTQVTIEINGEEFTEIVDYSFTSDVTALTDTATINIASPDGIHAGKVEPGMRARIYFSDPAVGGGAKVQQLTGPVTNVRHTARGGGKLQVRIADQGWYLEQCDAPLWLSLDGLTFGRLVERLLQARYVSTRRILVEDTATQTSRMRTIVTAQQFVDLGWGFVNADGTLRIATENDRNTRLKQGRAGVERYRAELENFVAFIPPIQVETGMKVGQLLVDYARRERRIVGVSSDGVLLIFAPNYAQDASYRFELHPSTASEKTKARTNVIDADVDDGIDGLFTDISCITSRVWPQLHKNRENPNADKIRGRYTNLGTLPFYRQKTFSDGDMLDQEMADGRALWAWQQGLFQSYGITLRVPGHVQNGLFYAPNTIAALDLAMLRISGNYYIQSCRYSRTRTDGTETMLTIRQKDLLAA